MRRARDILYSTMKRWRWIKILEILLLSIGLAICAYLIFMNFWMALCILILIFLAGLLYRKPWRLSLAQVCSHVDASVPQMEHSSGLLLKETEQLSVLSQLQQDKVSQVLMEHRKEVRFQNYLIPLSVFVLLCLLVAGSLWASGKLVTKNDTPETRPTDVVNFQPLDSVRKDNVAPKLIGQKVNIIYPSYTKKASVSTPKMNLKVLEGSRITWAIEFDRPIARAALVLGEDSLSMKQDKNTFTTTITADYSNFYSVTFLSPDGGRYTSDLYALEVYGDAPPSMVVEGLKQFQSFAYNAPQRMQFSTMVTDDFGVSDVAIIATVSKGTGESVKFREERLHFDSQFQVGAKQQKLIKSLDLRNLQMAPGDELYFYMEAKDNRRPKPNISRTETFFAVLKDTVTDLFAVEGTLGADLMPDYFRSQRQLIIDTEKLIAEQPTIETKTFNFRSNELGYDQKALRIKYGEFMGDETEGGPMETEVREAEITEDPLAEYTHDHDGANEHNLVTETHEAHDDEEADEDPLEAYVHNHEDPEASTLFAQSLKSKLKQAMAEMWDAELYLRLFQPKKSLPYQYRALKLIQEIKNSARIYVHRIGFDPPPIKEENRLTGELKSVGNFTKKEERGEEDTFPHMKKALAFLERMGEEEDALTRENRLLLDEAGNELARLAIAEPGKYLQTLQTLKFMSQANKVSLFQIKKVKNGLYDALPKEELLPGTRQRYTSKLTQLFMDTLYADK